MPDSNTAWAPIRLLVAIGLLIPIAYGLNSGQYLTLAIAKLGSGLATNGWLAYNTTVATGFASGGYANVNPLGYAASHTGGTNANEVLLPKPQMSDAGPFAAAMQLVRACEYAYMKRYGFTNRNVAIGVGSLNVTFERIRPWLVKPGAAPVPLTGPANASYQGVSASGATPPVFTPGGGGSPYDNYDQALQYYDYGDVMIRFGAPKPEAGPNYDPNTIIPYCGEITLTTTAAAPIPATGAPAGAWHLQKRYYQMVIEQWIDFVNRAHAARYGEASSTGMGRYFRPCSIPDALLAAGSAGISNANVLTILGTNNNNVTGPAGCMLPPNSDQKTAIFKEIESSIETHINEAWNRMILVPSIYNLTLAVERRGWAAAGMWYNNMANVIGREFEAASNTPYLSKMPAVMSEVRRLVGPASQNVSGVDIYNPLSMPNDEFISEMMLARDVDIAKTLYHVYKDWQEDVIDSNSISILGDNNVMTSVMHGIFGTERLVRVLEEESYEVHPMAQLIAIGKDLVNSTLINVFASVGFSIAGGVFQASEDAGNAGIANALSGAFSTIALVGLTAGFLLYYVLPFMPFLYFFFAVGTWVKTIFEAMVGVPLWALAHIRIDREGLPGDAAANGYFLLLEIFIRPILIVFSLIASFIIFGALVRVLHEVFDLVVQNVTGFEEKELPLFGGGGTLAANFQIELGFKRSIIDEFFYTLIYVFAVYVIGLSCFKLIDAIPQSILRWGGAGVSSFGDKYQDPAENLAQYAAIGGYVVGRQALSGATGMGRAAGQGGGALGQRFGMFQNRTQQLSGQYGATNRAPVPSVGPG